MNEYGISLLILTSSMFLIFLGFLLWGIKTGQLENIEEAKYRMLDTPDIPEKEE